MTTPTTTWQKELDLLRRDLETDRYCERCGFVFRGSERDRCPRCDSRRSHTL